MEWLTAIFGAVQAFFGWKTKTDLPPEKKEVREARKEYEKNNAVIDYAAAHGGRLPNRQDGKPDGHQQ